MKNTWITATIILLNFTDTAKAHSFWLEPSQHAPRPGELVSFTLLVGEEFTGEEFGRHPSHLKWFRLQGVDGSEPVDISGRAGRSPAGYVQINQSSPMIASYVSNFTDTTLSAETFRNYVVSEGIKKQVGPDQMKSEKSVTESFGRNAKTLLVPEGHAGSKIDRYTGMTLELVCQCDTLSLPGKGVGELRMKWQLLFDGKPLADRMVFLESKTGKKVVSSATTDSEGMVEFGISEAGIYLARSINILPAGQQGIDWRSHWSSVTFQVTETKLEK